MKYLLPFLLALPAWGRPSQVRQQLFNGKDLTGWKHVGPGKMVVEDGLMHGQGGMGLVVVNGVKVTDYTEGDPVPPRKFDFEPQRGSRPAEGWFGIQNHSDKDIVYFKEISVYYAR